MWQSSTKNHSFLNENLRYSQLSLRRTLFGQTLTVPHIERCSYYKEANKGSRERQEPTLGVYFTEESVKRELNSLLA